MTSESNNATNLELQGDIELKPLTSSELFALKVATSFALGKPSWHKSRSKDETCNLVLARAKIDAMHTKAIRENRASLKGGQSE